MITELGLAEIQDSIEYQLISEHYKDKKSERFKISYMKHIDDGIQILGAINTDFDVIRAFCLHPIVQIDEALKEFYESEDIFHIDQHILALAFEYRYIANSYLSNKAIQHYSHIKLSPIKEVNQMLIADKVSNYHELIKHKNVLNDANYLRLSEYFSNWLTVLNIDDIKFETLRKLCSQ